MNIDHPFISSILYNYHQIVEKVKIVNPSHIHVNNKAVMAAKSALQLRVAKFLIQI